MTNSNDFPPLVYAILAAAVVAGFALIGRPSWWAVPVTFVCVYVFEWLRRRRSI